MVKKESDYNRYTIRMSEEQTKKLTLWTTWLVREKVIPKQKDSDAVNLALSLMNELILSPALQSEQTFDEIVSKYRNFSQNMRDENVLQPIIAGMNRVEEAVQILTLLELNNYVAQDVPVDVKIAAMQTTTVKNSKVAQVAAKLREMYQNMKVKRINDSKVDRL